jgi:hypothetical protein
MNNEIITVQVAKSNPAIKALVAQLFPQYTGRKITVRVFSNAYQFTTYVGDADEACLTDSDGAYRYASQPSYGGVGSVTWTVDDGRVLVMHHRRLAKSISINIVANGLDTSDVAVLVDALLDGTKVARVTAQAMLSERTPGMEWGSLDKGFEKITARDLIFAALEATVATARKQEAKAVYA